MDHDQPDQSPVHHHDMHSDMPMAAHGSPNDPSNDMSDCCNVDGEKQSHDCSETMDCGSCTAFASLVNRIAHVANPSSFTYSPTPQTGLIVPSHTYPPYRPPIS